MTQLARVQMSGTDKKSQVQKHTICTLSYMWIPRITINTAKRLPSVLLKINKYILRNFFKSKVVGN